MEFMGDPVVVFVSFCFLILMLGFIFYQNQRQARLIEKKISDAQLATQSLFDLLNESLSQNIHKVAQNCQDKLSEDIKVILDHARINQTEVLDVVNKSNSSTEKLFTEANETISLLTETVRDELKKIQETVKHNAAYTKGIVDRVGEKVLHGISGIESTIMTQSERVTETTLNIEKSNLDALRSVESELSDYFGKTTDIQTGKINELVNSAQQEIYDYVQGSEDRLADVISLMRVSNSIFENKNLYDSGHLVIEDSSFLKIFDSCQLTRLEDKLTGQVTKNEYRDGALFRSETYRDDRLEYVGHYQDGRLASMEDLTGPDVGKTVYEYDESGEIESIK